MWDFLGLRGNDEQRKHLAGTLRAIGVGQFAYFVYRGLTAPPVGMFDIILSVLALIILEGVALFILEGVRDV